MPFRNTFTGFVKWVGYDLGITPNQITVGRLVFFVPAWLMWVYMHELAQWSGLPWQSFGWAAVVLVTTVIVLDLFDGALARETGQISEQGKILDPAVDKLITYSVLGLYWVAINKFALIALFILDMISTFIRGVEVKGANQFGKKKALCQNISKFFFASAILLPLPVMNTIGNLLIISALVLASISVGIRLLPKSQ